MLTNRQMDEQSIINPVKYKSSERPMDKYQKVPL